MKNKNYPLNNIEPIKNLKELVDYASIKNWKKTAFAFERKKEIVKVSYYKFKLDVDALGTYFVERNIRNTKFALIGENSYEWILTYFSVVSSGNVIIPLDRELPKEEIENLVLDSGAQFFIYSNAFSDIAEYLKSCGVPIQEYISMEDTLPNLLEQGDMQIHYSHIKTLDYEIDNTATAAILYTSGTTGNAKGVMLSHRGLAQDTVAACQHVEIIGSNMLVLPLHHTFGFVAGVCAMILQGSEICINSSLKHILSDLKKFEPSNMFLVPLFVETFYKRIWETAKTKGKDETLRKLIQFSNNLLKMGIDIRRLLFKSVIQAFGGNLTLMVSGGAPLDAKYVKGFRELGINLLNGYGITECSPIVSVNRNKYYRDGSVGLVLPCCQVKIIDPDENGHGEICVKGDIIMLGYYKNEQATKEVFAGGWFKSGDIGYLDSDGFLFVSGRKKNLIILSNGKNVHPEEIESALLNISYIKEAVVSANDNAIVAEVFLDTDAEPDCAAQLDGDILKLNRILPPYKNIGKIIIRETEFPKTTTKKIKRQYA